MSFFAHNLALLKQASEPLAQALLFMHGQRGEPDTIGPFSIENAKNGTPTLRYTDAETGRSTYLHSPYDPQREASQYAQRLMETSPKGNFTVCLGLGLGYGVEEMLKLLPEDERVLVFEPHWDLFYLAFCNRDLSFLMGRKNLTLTCDREYSGSMWNYMNLFELAGFKGLRWVTSPAFENLPYSSSFKDVAEKIRYEMMTVGGNVQTLMVMGEMQQMNIVLNFPHILDNPPFENLIGAFKGRPVVIVSAGPSLEKNMHLLKELDERAVIIAVDTAVKPLMAAGITPHVVVTGDPQEANYRHLKGVDLPEAYLIAEPQSPVNSLRDWTGPRFICSFHDNMMRWVDRVMGSRGKVIVWGSVAVMAYDIAVKLGCDPIVFIGQDLSFPGGRTYTGGTVFETEDKQEMTVKALQSRGTPLIDQIDIYGEPIKTNRQMYAYLGFLKNRFDDPEVRSRTLINATEGGILMHPRMKILSLAEAIEQYMGKRFDVWGTLEQAHGAGNPINYPNVLSELDGLLAALRQSLEYTVRGVELVGRTLEALEHEDGSKAARTDVVEAYNRMIGMRKFVTHHEEAGKMLELANQAGIFAFAQGVKNVKRDDEELTNDFLKRACYHYHTLYVSSREAIERLIPLFEMAREQARERSLRMGSAVAV